MKSFATPFADACYANSPTDTGIFYSSSFQGMVNIMVGLAALNIRPYVNSIDYGVGSSPRMEVCHQGIDGTSGRVVQCIGACSGAPIGILPIRFDSSGHYLPYQCAIHPIRILFYNGLTNDRSEARKNMDSLEDKVDDQLDDLGIINDPQIDPSCHKIVVKTKFYDHGWAEKKANLKQLGGELVESFFPIIFNPEAPNLEVITEVLGDPVDPVRISALIADQDGFTGYTLIVAHSLGNKVANAVYEESQNKPKVIAIGTTESTVGGDGESITHQDDLMISIAKLIKAANGEALPIEGLVEGTLNPVDSQHGFDDYLKDPSPGRTAICEGTKSLITQPGNLEDIPNQ